MIAVQLNKKDFEYDIHSLVRAFYPGVDVPIYYDNDSTQEPYEFKIMITYSDTRIVIAFIEPTGIIAVKRMIEVDYYAERKDTKNHLKKLLYGMLQERTGQKLPWGTLTGIRPTKIPMALLEKGMKNTEAADYMRDTYYCSSEKTALSIMIANRERYILKDINYKNGYSLYIGIPFCPSICSYCSFSSSPIKVWKDKVEAYLDALCKEIEFAASLYKGRELNTVYIGGGTPTTLEPNQLKRLLSKVEECFDISRLQEYTVEAGRPDSITRDKLLAIRQYPVTRISINPQTMNDKTLEIIGRKHTVAQTKEAFLLAREVGFDNINMDLIVGLPGEEKKDVEHTIREVTALDPESITVHSLAVKRAARLTMFKDDYKEMTFTNNREIMDMTAEIAQKCGLSPYYLYRQKNMAGNFENVGYAKPDKAGIYNILIMEEKQSIVALGAGAATKLVLSEEQIERIENVKDIKGYIERIDDMIERKRQGFLKYEGELV